MCGIGGVLRIYEPGEPVPPHHESIPEAWLDTLDDAIKHRGPDGQGRFRDRAVREDGTTVDIALVHRRLSIIDHAGGQQPMVHVRRQDGSGELLSGRLAPQTTPSDARPIAHAPGSFMRGSDEARSPHTGSPSVSAGPHTNTPEPHPQPHPQQRAPRASEGSPPSPLHPNILDATTLPPDTDLIAVAFNGCIYNHRELREELEALGHRFETDHADTEVLLHGWRAWGLRMQDEFDGMYAVLIWDRRTGQLAWGRDLAGEKPLYERWSYGTAIRVFSSIAGVLPMLDLSTGDGRDAPNRVLTPDYPCPLRVGYWMQLGAARHPIGDTGTESPARWNVLPNHPAHGGSTQTRIGTASLISHRSSPLPERTDPGPRFGHRSRPRPKALLESAITSRLEADAPLGLFLSGGIDSALIAAIAKQHRPDIRAFTVRMPDSPSGRFDESEAAAETAAHLGIDHTILDCQPEHAADDLVALIEQLGLPFGDSSLLPTHWVCRAAREHIKVALSGDGGDELFGGYRRHTIAPTIDRWRHLLRLIPDALLDRRRPGSRTEYLARLAVAARHGGYEELLSIFPTPDLRRLIPAIDGERPGNDQYRDTPDPLRHDFEHYLPDDLLRKTDTASMAVALEVRAPFLARKLVDAALRTPLDILMPNGQRKGLLKQLAREHLPDHIINRPKQGFAIPIGDWFRSDFGGLRILLHDQLHSADPFPGLADAGININTAHVRRLLREHDAAGERSINPWKGRDHSQRLYMLLVLSIWSRWLARVPRVPPAPSGG